MDTKFLWMNATFAWDRAVKDFSYSVFFGFAASVVSLGYGVRYQLSKGISILSYISLFYHSTKTLPPARGVIREVHLCSFHFR